MRWYILRTLLHKELWRHLANRGGIALVVLLVAAALLLSFFGKSEGSPASTLVGGVRSCYVDYWEDGPWIEHLRNNVPPELEKTVEFREARRAPTVNGQIVYPSGRGAIQVRT